MSEIIKAYELGDMQAVYFTDSEVKNAELLLLPAGIRYREKDIDKAHDHKDSLVQIKLTGDTYTGGYASGVSMRMDTALSTFLYAGQELSESGDDKEIITYLKDKRGY